MASGVYLIENTANGRRYVGSAVDLDKRQKEHWRALRRGLHHSRFLQRAWGKYGEASFVFRPALHCDPVNLVFYEQALMDGMRPAYNMTPTAGSQLGFRHGPETKVRMSEAAKRNRNFAGHRHSDETKLRISENRKGKGGGPRTPERLAKISAALKGRPVSPETRLRIAAALIGRKQNPETVAKRAASSRATWAAKRGSA